MTNYNATATLTTPFARLPMSTIDVMLDELAAYAPAIVPGPTGDTEIVITLPADNLTQAITTARTILTKYRPIGLEVIPTDLWDKRQNVTPVPELLSVTDVATLLNVTRQAVLQRVESGSLPAVKVGSAWIIPASSLTHHPSRRHATLENASPSTRRQ